MSTERRQQKYISLWYTTSTLNLQVVLCFEYLFALVCKLLEVGRYRRWIGVWFGSLVAICCRNERLYATNYLWRGRCRCSCLFPFVVIVAVVIAVLWLCADWMWSGGGGMRCVNAVHDGCVIFQHKVLVWLIQICCIIIIGVVWGIVVVVGIYIVICFSGEIWATASGRMISFSCSCCCCCCWWCCHCCCCCCCCVRVWVSDSSSIYLFKVRTVEKIVIIVEVVLQSRWVLPKNTERETKRVCVRKKRRERKSENRKVEMHTS